ncbi:growth arrest-specific protein 1-like [Ischnura elegans]|uniref:growth arrest-specific protein 1-like n=1 Tax=Ischnura elegans TaxID=197161 RepID=UPI001ED8B2CF|nr:growth arrest-specific protein 1-like [Ischnura elegans]
MHRTMVLIVVLAAAACFFSAAAETSSEERERRHHRHQRYRHRGAPESSPFLPPAAGSRGNGGEIMCEEAKMKCAYREGCGEALQRFVAACSEIAIGTRLGRTRGRGEDDDEEEMPACSEPCQHALIALTSTEEGQALITCRCSDESCEGAKRRASACAPAVAAASRPDAVLPCRVAQLVCSADPQCSTALGYYERLCRAAFSGRKCTPKCRNSATILRRQPKAAGLSSCRCDGREDYDCDLVRRNTERLCFRRDPPPLPTSPPPPERGDIPLIPAVAEADGKGAVGDTRTNEIVRISGAALAGGRSGAAPSSSFCTSSFLAWCMLVVVAAWAPHPALLSTRPHPS